MTVEYLLFACLITFIACFYIGKSVIQNVAIDYYKEQLKKYSEQLAKHDEDNSVVMKYCLNCILEKSVEIEDYKTAELCSNLIKKLNEHEKDNSKD